MAIISLAFLFTINSFASLELHYDDIPDVIHYETDVSGPIGLTPFPHVKKGLFEAKKLSLEPALVQVGINPSGSFLEITVPHGAIKKSVVVAWNSDKDCRSEVLLVASPLRFYGPFNAVEDLRVALSNNLPVECDINRFDAATFIGRDYPQRKWLSCYKLRQSARESRVGVGQLLECRYSKL